MQLSWNDEDLCGAFALAQHIAALDPLTLKKSNAGRKLESIRIDIFSDALRLYAVSSKPEILTFLRWIINVIGNGQVRTRVRRYLNQIERGEHTPRAIIGWANESWFQSIHAVVRMDPALRRDVEEAAETLDDPTHVARALMRLWEETRAPEHLAMTRAAIDEIPLDEDRGDSRARVLGDLASTTNDPEDLQTWRQVIRLIGNQVDQLSELANLCEVKAEID